MGGALEYALDSVVPCRAVRAERGGSRAYAVSVAIESGTVARSQLGEGSAVNPLEGGLQEVNSRRGDSQEGIAAQPGDSSLNCACVDAEEGRPARVRVDYLFYGEERRQGVSARRLKGSLHAAGSGVGGHQPV